MVSITTGLSIRDMTGYHGHHDHLVGEEVVRTFVFGVTVTDPKRICESAYIGHRWNSQPIMESLVIPSNSELFGHTTKPARPTFNRSAGL